MDQGRPGHGHGEANKVGLYCNRDWWFNHDTTGVRGDYLWIAIYTNGGDDPGIEYDWTFHQYSMRAVRPEPGAEFADLATLQAWAGGPEAPPSRHDSGPDGAWFSTDYLFPRSSPNPTNPNRCEEGRQGQGHRHGGVTARQLPGGPKTLDKDGKTLVRETGLHVRS